MTYQALLCNDSQAQGFTEGCNVAKGHDAWQPVVALAVADVVYHCGNTTRSYH